MLTYREDNRDTSSHGLAAVEHGVVADEQVLLAIALPADDRRAVQQDLHSVTGRQGCVDAATLGVHGGLRATSGGGDGAGLVGTVHGRYCLRVKVRWVKR